MTTAISVKQRGQISIFGEIRSVVKGNKSLISITTDDTIAGKVAERLIEYVNLENRTRTSTLDFGEISHKLLELPLVEQQTIVMALAEKMGVPTPEYNGNYGSGREQWAHVVYGKYPELCKARKGDSTTLALKRVNEAVRLYRLSAGLLLPPSKRRKVNKRRLPVQQLHKAFDWLVTAVESPEEMNIISELYVRLGIEESVVAKWVESTTKSIAA